jgi:hypothetical protein
MTKEGSSSQESSSSQEGISSSQNGSGGIELPSERGRATTYRALRDGQGGAVNPTPRELRIHVFREEVVVLGRANPSALGTTRPARLTFRVRRNQGRGRLYQSVEWTGFGWWPCVGRKSSRQSRKTRPCRNPSFITLDLPQSTQEAGTDRRQYVGGYRNVPAHPSADHKRRRGVAATHRSFWPHRAEPVGVVAFPDLGRSRFRVPACTFALP